MNTNYSDFAQEAAQWMQGLQDEICGALEQLDGRAQFHEDLWQRAEGGGGRTRILQEGALLEKGGVAFSAVHGPISEVMQEKLHMPQGQFFATGVSIVLHPESPRVPIIHMNVRYFEILDASGQVKEQWFGGGIDLTPIYVVPAQAKRFHERLKAVCDAFAPEAYERYKQWADDYFYLPHRQETRGIGGIFFDRLRPSDKHSKEEIWRFVQALGKTFVPAYKEIVEENRNLPYKAENKRWQALRRSRYVEFNLVYDAGTKFGLESNGRTESILMSMPPQAQWAYNYQPPQGSAEAETLAHLKKGIVW
jgi:coproporphyrinogen III oxidase